MTRKKKAATPAATHQWFRLIFVSDLEGYVKEAIPGATNATYTPTKDEAGCPIVCDTRIAPISATPLTFPASLRR